jgi:hypothetical protein
MLNAFYAWVRTTLDHMPEDINTQLTMGQSAHNPSIRIEIATDNANGSVTCWECGNFHANITDSWSHQPRYTVQGKLDPAQPLGPQLHDFLSKLGVADFASVSQS